VGKVSMPGADGVRRPHLLDITMFWSPRGGGVARYLRSKRDWLGAHSNWRHTIMTPGPSTPETIGIAAMPLPFSGGYRFPLRRNATARAIVRRKPDLIEVGDPYRCAWAALDAGQQLGVPVAAVCHSNVEALAKQWLPRASHALVRQYLRHLYQRFDAVFAPSHWAADALRELGLDNVVLQPHGVDCHLFHPRRHDAAWRLEVGCAASDIVLLYAGRFAPEKNLDRLAAAVDHLGAPYRLIAIGDGPRPPRGARLRVLPYQSDTVALARALASADIFVHAGNQETFGLAALEALACGTPVIARACAGLTDLIDGRSAIGVERDDTALFAETIAAAAPMAATLRTEARRRALEFDANHAFSQLLNRYTTLCISAHSGSAEAKEERYAA
jgi:alpha-1,6-mannosyltransferase